MSKIINQDCKLHRFIAFDIGESRDRVFISVPIQGTLFRGNKLYVYGQHDDTENLFDSNEKASKLDLIHQKSAYVNYTKAPYIQDYIDPEDGQIVYSHNTVFRYIERRVYDLCGSWETSTEFAICNGNLFLNINGHKIFPEVHKINKGMGGFYVSFTINIDHEQAKKITYSNISNCNISQYKYHAVANGLSTPIPIPKQFIANYLKKLITLKFCNIDFIKEKSIKIKDIKLINDQVIVFGDECNANLLSSSGQEVRDQESPPKYEK